MENKLSTEHLETLMRRYTIPCIISLLVGALYNIVDQVFIPITLVLMAMLQIPLYSQ